MAFPPVSARWAARFLRHSSRATRAPIARRSAQQLQRRSYASEGGGAHDSHKPGSDLPWAITSVVVTLPCLWYLLQPQLQAKEHGGGHGHDEHGEHSEESHEEAEEEEGGAEDSKSEDKEQESNEGQEEGDDGQEKEEQGDQGGDLGGDQSADDSDSSSGEGQDTPETSEDEGSDDESSQGRKSARNNNTIVTYPDAKGGIKKRYQSNNAKVLGKADSEEQDPDNEDMGASSKSTGDKATQSGKQEGLSNTDTKHSVDISNDPDKSKKGEGVPETAKLKGTVDPNRPAR